MIFNLKKKQICLRRTNVQLESFVATVKEPSRCSEIFFKRIQVYLLSVGEAVAFFEKGDFVTSAVLLSPGRPVHVDHAG